MTFFGVGAGHLAGEEGVIKLLRKKGYNLKERKPYGRVDGILVNPNGTYQGGADPRGDDKIEGY